MFRWALACALLAAPIAHAQDTHHQNLAVGDRAIGMGGAFTGLATDQAAAWYNPAGLAFLQGDTVSGSLLLHAFERIRVGDSGELRLRHPRRSSFPLFATGMVRLGEEVEGSHRHALGIVVYRPLQIRRRFELEVTSPAGAPSTLFIDREEHETDVGLSWASRLAPRFSIGATVLLTIEQFGHREFLTDVADGSSDVVLRNSRLEIKANYLLVRLGALVDLGRFRLGFMVQPPGAPLRRDGHVEEQRVATATANGFYGQADVNARLPHPMEARIGASYRFASEVVLSGDVQMVLPLVDGALAEAPYPGDEAADQPALGAFIDRSTKRRPILNGSVGFEWRASSGVLLRFGGFTDFSTARRIPRTTDTYQERRIPSFGGSGSVGLDFGGQHLNIGVAGQGGRGDALTMDPRGNVQDPTYQRVEAKRRVIFFFVTGTLTGE